jgi:PAS domain S-box-containing protein
MEHSGMISPQFILDSIYNGVVTIDADGVIIYFNKSAERIFGISSHEALRRYILEILPNTGGRLIEVLKTGNPLHGEKLKGEKVTLISNISPVMAGGKILGVVSVFQDISKIENISKELDLYKTMKNWLDTIIDSSYDGLWICDCKGKVIMINKASERINGVKAEQVVGRNMKELLAEGLFDKSVTFEVLKRKTSVTMFHRNKLGGKTLITGNPIFDENGEITFVVSNDRDISELDQLRSQLQESQALAKGYISKLTELEAKNVDICNVVFRSETMERIIETALRVAKVDSTILLLGESGVGKGMIAKLIHKQSGRNTGSFIRVNCAGIPDSLLESELFGYEKGAFTGAKIEGKPGFFELADRGTLFLDEVAEIPLQSQSKLLHFLEDREITRVGGTEPKKIDVRIIAATNRNIEEMVSSKLLREDLYYRLSIIPICIPPLRERGEDILSLIFYFLRKTNLLYKKNKVLSPEAVEILCKYEFPGNIRELSNIVERLVVISEEDRIRKEDLPSAVLKTHHRWDCAAFLGEDIPFKDAVERYERLIIEYMVKKHGSQRVAAKVLKVNQATISRRMKKYCLFGADAIMHK